MVRHVVGDLPMRPQKLGPRLLFVVALLSARSTPTLFFRCSERGRRSGDVLAVRMAQLAVYALEALPRLMFGGDVVIKLH